MKTWKLKNGYIIYQVLNGRCNSYLISSPSGNVIVDTGMKRNLNKLLKNIKSVELSNSKINFLILTHSHFDHCQSAQFLKEIENCRIILGESEREFAMNGYTPLPKGTNWFTGKLSRLGNFIGQKVFGYKPFSTDITLENLHSLKNEGFDIELINTSGHSPGSLSVIVNNEIALVGDTMFGVFQNSIFPPFADDINELFRSWKKLLDTGCNLFLPGHGKEIKRVLVERELKKEGLN